MIKIYRKKLLTLFFIALLGAIPSHTYGQGIELMQNAVSYLRVNESVKDGINWLTDGTRRVKRNYRRYVNVKRTPLRISNHFEAITYTHFRSVEGCKLDFWDELGKSNSTKELDDEILTSLSNNRRSNIYVYFDQPKGDFIMCEIVYGLYDDMSHKLNASYGSVLKVFLHFNDNFEIMSHCLIEFERA